MDTSPEEYYRQLAPIYDELYQDIVPYQAGFDFINRLREVFKLEKTIIDVALGTGELLRYFERAGYTTYGSDITAAMIEVAKKKLPRTKLKQGDYGSIDFNVQVDIIVSFFNSFAYTITLDRFLEVVLHLKSLLKRGGLLIFDIMTTSSPQETYQVKQYEFHDKLISRTFYGYPIDDVFHSTMTYVINNRLTDETDIVKATTKRGIFTRIQVENILRSAGYEVIDPRDGYADYTTFVGRKNH